MTTAPNIEMIASSLRNCSLNTPTNTPASPSSSSSSSYQPGVQHQLPQRVSGAGGDLTVELNSDVALPFHWEQCLDIRSGQVYYINWEDGTRTNVDPRVCSRSMFLYDSSAGEDDPETDPEEEEEEEEEAVAALEAQQMYSYDSSTSDTDSCSGVNTESSYTSNLSASSSFSPTESSSSGGFGAFSGGSNGAGTANGGEVLVAAGCKACFMYFMVPKHVNVCPKCGGAGLLHLGRA